MSDSKHTPGPWHVSHHEEDGNPEVHCYEGPTRFGICTIWQQSGGNIDGAEDEANARLIAAAPDLLSAAKAALRRMREDYPEERDGYGIPSRNPGAVRITCDRLRAAIAKAEGRLQDELGNES